MNYRSKARAIQIKTRHEFEPNTQTQNSELHRYKSAIVPT